MLQRLLIAYIIEFFLAKLHFHGIEGVSEDWFRSCLGDRKLK
jgi:hypothetical protein